MKRELKLLVHNTIIHPIAGWMWAYAALLNGIADLMHDGLDIDNGN